MKVKLKAAMQRKIMVLLSLLVVTATSIRAQSETALIIDRYRQYLLNSTEPEEDPAKLAVSLNAAHQWEDINYNDTEPANWKLLIHLKRVRDLALVWANPHSSFYHQEAIWKPLSAGLDHWLEKRYQNSNWWHNQIGVPQCIRDIIILTRERLSPQQLNGALEVLAQHHVQGHGAGANLVWSADLGFHYGALTNNRELMQQCRDLMVSEIQITTGEGIQPDFSFHQHGKRLQMYQYGRAFLWDNVRLAWQVRGTALAFPQDKINILTDFVLEGWQWMARGIHTVPGTMDRSASRKDALESADMRKLIPCLKELRPEKAAEFTAMARRQNGEGALQGYRYYPYSDFTSYHQKDFSFFLKTISDRTLATESINHENLRGWLLNSGDAYILRNGEAYFNLMPVWNWQWLPGITSFKGAYKIKRMPFVGNVSNGKVGLAVMDYCLEDREQKKGIAARKFWACHGNLVVCLIAGLEARNIHEEVVTALDQCRWKEKVIVNQPEAVVGQGKHTMDQVRWIYHSGFAYIPLQPSRMELHLDTVTGSWKSINASLSDAPVTEKVFTPLLVHDAQTKNSSTGYILASCASARQAQKLVRRPEWKVVRNDKDCQAVSFRDGTTMIAFFQPGSIPLSGNKKITTDRPCLILIAENQLYASDPLQKGGLLTVGLNGQTFTVELPDHGFSTEGRKLK